MTFTRDNLASITYWGERLAQRFYIAFCLLMSSLQDWALGQKERRSKNLNWSANCSYYSLVHAGRLFVFLALGDYLTSHFRLKELFSSLGPAAARQKRLLGGYPFDWLRDFSRVTGAAVGVEQTPAISGSLIDLHDAVIKYLRQLCVTRAAERIERFGHVLSSAGELRTDSNYEALLIAHEYRHARMSSAFEKLARCMGDAAESQLHLATEAFSRFVQSDPDLEINRREYAAFSYHYLRGRLLDGIQRKLGQYPDIQERLISLVSEIEVANTNADYSRLELAVSFDLFEGKARLMSGFEQHIDELCDMVSEP